VINSYLKKGIIPLINENDVVSKEELMENSSNKFTDNDVLAALVAIELKADRLLLITDVEGLCDVDPKKNKCANVVEKIDNIDRDIENMASRETNSLGRGGMISKILAAKMVKKHKIETIVGSGSHNILDLLDGNVKRTLFKS
jgi:glutamate 5-kinase